MANLAALSVSKNNAERRKEDEVVERLYIASKMLGDLDFAVAAWDHWDIQTVVTGACHW